MATSDPPGSKHLQFAPSYRDVRFALQSVRSWLQVLEIEPEAACLCEQALAEAFNNVVEHAGLNASQRVDVMLLHDESQLVCQIQDHGRGYPCDQLPAGQAPRIAGAVAELPEGGFGWMMIRHIAREIRYERLGSTNKLTLFIPAPQV